MFARSKWLKGPSDTLLSWMEVNSVKWLLVPQYKALGMHSLEHNM